jgi:hypothetical protein
MVWLVDQVVAVVNMPAGVQAVLGIHRPLHQVKEVLVEPAMNPTIQLVGVEAQEQ